VGDNNVLFGTTGGRGDGEISGQHQLASSKALITWTHRDLKMQSGVENGRI
jgi:hypothetical protein